MASKKELVQAIEKFWNLLNECDWLHKGGKPIIKGNVNAILLLIASMLNKGNTKDVLQAINEVVKEKKFNE